MFVHDYYEVNMCKRIFANQTNIQGGIPFYKIGTIGSTPDAYISEELYDEYAQKYKIPSIGDTLITCSGTIGRCIRYNGEKAYYQDSNIVWLKSKTSPMTKDFLYILLKKHNWKSLNSTTITRLYNSNLLELSFYYPSIIEQNKIYNFLMLIENRIETQKKIIEDYKLLKKAICDDYRKQNCTKCKIKDLALIGRGRVINSTEISHQKNPKYPVYSSQTLNNGIMGYLDGYDFDGEYITWTTDGANAGTVFYHNEKFNCTNVCGTIKVTNKMINPFYLSLILQYECKKYVSLNLANPKLMNNTMASIEVKVPNLDYQKRIINSVKIIDEKILNEEKVLQLYQSQKDYLLNHMFI